MESSVVCTEENNCEVTGQAVHPSDKPCSQGARDSNLSRFGNSMDEEGRMAWQTVTALDSVCGLHVALARSSAKL